MDKNVFITGTSRGIGKSIKHAYTINGWNTNKHNSKILDLSDTKNLAKFLKKEFIENPPDTIVLNASINENIKFKEINEESLNSSLKIAINSNILIIQSAIEHMKKNNFGRIVLIGSIWSKSSRISKSIYSIAKASLTGLSTSLSVEYSKYNILTNIVSPGFVNTEMTNKNLSENDKLKFTSRIPQGRFADPAEIAELVYFLGSEKNTYITGQEIFIDGGFNIGWN